jgi:hypothetical protein
MLKDHALSDYDQRGSLGGSAGGSSGFIARGGEGFKPNGPQQAEP